MTFSEVAEELGVEFLHDRGSSGAKHLPETMGSGLAWLDYDGDGWLDLYLVQSGGDAGGANVLFRNVDGRAFVEVTRRSGVGEEGYGQGVLAADFDGDGAVDLFVANLGYNALLLNDGRGRFVDASEASGLREPVDSAWSSSAAAADFDLDGDLDLYVANYVEYDPEAVPFCGDPESGERQYCDPSLFRGAADRFYVNLGGGRFEEAGATVGVAAALGSAGEGGARGLGVVFTDLDGDRRPDLYVANDLDPNFLFRNAGAGAFEDLSLFSGAAVNRDGKPEAGMGLVVADFDRDADPDLVVTNFDVETNTLYRNHSDGGGLFFADESAASGVGPPSFNRLGFGAVSEDFTGDGLADLLVGNGHIFERPKRDNTPYAQPLLLLRGDGRGGFEAVDCGLGGSSAVARGLAAADFDNDGDADFVVQQNGRQALVYRADRENQTGLGASNGVSLRDGLGDGLRDGDTGRWLGVELAAEGTNRAAVGARIELVTGTIRRTRWRLAGDSYQSTSDGRTRFSLAVGEAADRLELEWPSGRRTRLVTPPIGRYLKIYESPAGDATPRPPGSGSSGSP